MKERKRIVRKAQISVFVILGIMLFAAGGIAFFVTKQSSDSSFDKDLFSQQDIKAKVTGILNSIRDCEDLSADASIVRIGLQGGYNKHPENYLDFGWMFIPYYFIEGETYMPDKNQIEKELGESFDQSFQGCLKSVDTGDLDLNVKPSKTITEISKGNIKFNIEMPFTIGKDRNQAKYNLNDDPLIKNYKFYEMYEIAKYITDSHKNNPPSLCMDCLVSMADERGLFVDFANLGETTKIVMITEDLNETKEASDFVFQFVEKYKAEEKTTAPKIPEGV